MQYLIGLIDKNKYRGNQKPKIDEINTHDKNDISISNINWSKCKEFDFGFDINII